MEKSQDSGVAVANQTKERSVHELFTRAFRNKSSTFIVLVFLRKNTTEFRRKWPKFMNFSFWPFLWFGLPGRLKEKTRSRFLEGRVQALDPSDHLQESPGPKSQKNLKKDLFGGLEKSLKKYPKKSKNTEK